MFLNAEVLEVRGGEVPPVFLSRLNNDNTISQRRGMTSRSANTYIAIIVVQIYAKTC